jgi:hypothetical protein
MKEYINYEPLVNKSILHHIAVIHTKIQLLYQQIFLLL